MLELVAVAAIVSVLAAVALFSLRPTTEATLELATGRVAEVLRSARAEAIRTGQPHSVEFFEGTERIVASKVDMEQPSPPPLSTLIDPLTKQPLDFTLTGTSSTAAVDLVAARFDYTFQNNRSVVFFDVGGMPFWKQADISGRLTDGFVRLALDGSERVVHVAPITGRVTID